MSQTEKSLIDKLQDLEDGYFNGVNVINDDDAETIRQARYLITRMCKKTSEETEKQLQTENGIYTNWMKRRTAKLVEIRKKLIDVGFTFELRDIATGVEEILQLEIDTDYMLQVNIHHTWIDWYFSLWINQTKTPIDEDKFWKIVNRYHEVKTQENCFHWWLPKEHPQFPGEDYWICEWCGKIGDPLKEDH